MVLRVLLVLIGSLIHSDPLSSHAAGADLKGKITVLQAASLTELFREAEAAFEKQNPGVDVQIELGASMTLIRKVTDLDKEADVIALADRTLIPSFLMPEYVEDSSDFMTEQIALIVGDDAKYAGEINSENWHEILLRPDVEYGISNPKAAPVGYRTLMVWKLAEKHYNQPGLYKRLREALPKRNIRANATASLTLLKSGELDYIFDYGSLAKQNGLRVITLPPGINLSDPAFSETYGAVSIEIPGEKPGEKKSIQGSPIVYSIAPLKSAPNPAAARAFVEFILGPQGQMFAAELGMTYLSQMAAKQNR